ncbi:MAG: SLATT domain-containing protein [Ferruginibacter sp.]
MIQLRIPFNVTKQRNQLQELREKLRRIKREALYSNKAHLIASRRNYRLHKRLCMLIILSNVAIGLVLTYIHIDGMLRWMWMCYTSAVLAFSAALLTMVLAKLNLPKSAEGHKAFAGRYDAIFSKCDLLQNSLVNNNVTEEVIQHKVLSCCSALEMLNEEQFKLMPLRKDKTRAKKEIEAKSKGKRRS